MTMSTEKRCFKQVLEKELVLKINFTFSFKYEQEKPLDLSLCD